MRKNFLYIIIVVQIIVVVSLIKGILSSVGSEKRVDELLKTKQNLEKDKKEIEQKIAESKSEYYLEKVAREQLHLVKDGETVVILENNKPDSELNNKPQEDDNKPIWRKWVDVILHRN